MKIGFNNEKYIEQQTKYILEKTNGHKKLYLELGGKLFDDYHASRVLPGYDEANKINILKTMKDKVEIVIAINANDIESEKVRNDSGITYATETFRLIDIFRSLDLLVGSVVITQYKKHPSVLKFKKSLEKENIKVYKHYYIEDYPTNIQLLVSDKGFGKNEYVETERPLILLTAPGPGSGKLAVCLSQLYQDNKRNISSGYAKFETFPIWNLPLKHPINLAYESATADLGDSNIIDYYHLKEYGQVAVSYNRELEAFPVLDAILTKIYNKNIYKSPTDMGVNVIGFCIDDMEVCEEASNKEIIRRYYRALVNNRKGEGNDQEVKKIEWLMSQAEIDIDLLEEAKIAKEKSKKENGVPVLAIRLHNGKIITGKESNLFNASSACVLNALKELSGIPQDLDIIMLEAITPIQQLKSLIRNNEELQLNTNETLIALAATGGELADMALSKITELNKTTAHASVVIPKIDYLVLTELGIHLTAEPEFKDSKKIYKK